MEYRGDSSTVRTFIHNLFKSYFEDHNRRYDENASFSEFKVLWGSVAVQNTYPADLCGYISYNLDGMSEASRLFRVRYYHCPGNHPDRPTISSLFANEVAFYNDVWPLCADESTRSLVPQFVFFGKHVDETESVGALIFEHDDDFHAWRYECLRRYEHVELMARRIGEFHGRVLETRARNEAQLSEAMASMSPPVQPNASLAIPTLLRCVDLLEADLQFMLSADSAAGARRLRELVTELESRVQTPVNPACCVLCHRNYSTACGLFRYEGLALAEAKIGYWGMVGWASLADDLVALLFVETSLNRQTRKRCSLVVDQYIAGRRTAFPGAAVPTKREVWDEIKLRIPLALQILACRVNCLSRQAIPGSRPARKFPWNDRFVVNVYKLLITTGLV